MKAFGIVGYSGSGKTTLLEKLIPEIIGRGFRVSVIKHAHHGFDIDRPGKDTYRHRQAGAAEVMISSGERWALMHELREGVPPTLANLLARMSPCDLVLVEGFKDEPGPKLEVHRPAAGKPPIFPGRADIVALATDAEVEAAIPRLDLNDAAAVASFILDFCQLTGTARTPSRA